jgi:hypothetical protein
MVVGGHFRHDNNRQTTIAPSLCILLQNPTSCLNAGRKSKPVYFQPCVLSSTKLEKLTHICIDSEGPEFTNAGYNNPHVFYKT